MGKNKKSMMTLEDANVYTVSHGKPPKGWTLEYDGEDDDGALHYWRLTAPDGEHTFVAGPEEKVGW